MRNRAEQHGQIYTNLPKERFADARFDDTPRALTLPTLRKDGFILASSAGASDPKATGDYGRSTSSHFFSPISSERLDIHRCNLVSSARAPQPVHPLPFADDSLSCKKCFSPCEMNKLYMSGFIGSILSHSCSVCSELLSSSSIVRSVSPAYPFPVAHECDSCGWRVCLRCNITDSVDREKAKVKQSVESELEASFRSRIGLLEKQLEIGAHGESSDLLDSYKARVMDLETQLASERKAKDLAASSLASVQRDYMQHKTDVEMHLESNTAENVLLQSRLIEQSVLLADARARIDELSSTQRMERSDCVSGSSLTQREALLINENNHLKEEVDSLKVSIHIDFDNWKRVVLKQVKTECVKYRERLRKLHVEEFAEDPATPEESLNEKELDFLFDEVDWTGGIEELRQSPLRMKAYVSSRSSTPEKNALSQQHSFSKVVGS